MKPKLIGSASTLDAIHKLINKWLHTTVALESQGAALWHVYNSRGLIPGMRVVLTKGRYRLEAYDAT